ncbi:MAG TPA: RlmE family RNA methyltransferase [Myxococcota bacterium]|nr:RlmE family RNA methyltransferase [Myxococcota bacterium]
MPQKPLNPYRKPDRFTRAAKEQGFPARSVFKLSEVQRRHPLLRQGQRVVDLGCFPGSWSQYALQVIGPSGRLVGVDLQAPELAGGVFLARSVYEVSAEELIEALGGPADVVLSDMAPNTTGVAFTDHVRQMELARCAVERADAVLAPGGSLFLKVFDGEEVPAFQLDLRRRYAKLDRFRPEAVRRNSREFFLLASGRR